MPRAILSVHDKTGLVDFARGLHDLGWTLIASGGTAKALRENNIPVSEVADYTGSPEILGGRVKTLHPAIHGGLLARPTESDHAELLKLGWDYLDLVAVNLYPFEATIAKLDGPFDEVIDNIDIGGVTLIRAAAKNHQRVTLVCDPADYAAVLDELRAGSVTGETRQRLAVKGFASTAHYDSAIFNYLSGSQALQLTVYPVQTLRYGENPHQSATLYSYEPNGGPLGGQVLQGKELSYNNLLDLDAAWKGAVSFDRSAIVIVKHLSPCGIATADRLVDAFKAALACDPISAFGGVIASNQPFNGETAEALGELFVECIAAPAFTAEAGAILAKRKNCRLVEMPDLKINPPYELRSINHGLLKQDIDMGDPSPLSGTGGTEGGWKVVSKRQPTEAEWAALKFAWKACQHVKSNSIVFAQGEATVGIGGGQPNRVDCVRIAKERAGQKSIGAVMASDAFFPFPDSVEVAAQAGITAIVQPGGSMRDAESIAIVDANDIAMVTTGVRHFRH
jgi:phosphoribosylaminoimidazolecarboxamide formyltransferase/IMP cyclohydrolase